MKYLVDTAQIQEILEMGKSNAEYQANEQPQYDAADVIKQLDLMSVQHN